MKVIVPIDITQSMLISSTVPEPDTGEPAAWDSASAYDYNSSLVPPGDRVYYNRRIYEVLRDLTASNNAKYTPEQTLTRRVPWWVEVAPTNKWAMFDSFRSTGTTMVGGTGTVVVEPGQLITSLAVLNNLNVNYINITAVSVSDNVVRLTQTYDVQRREGTTTWYQYFFQVFEYSKPLIITNLPTEYGNLRITLEFSGLGSMSVGSVILGNYHNIGKLTLGASADALNFSVLERDTFGSLTMIPRRSVPKTTQSVYIDKNDLDGLISLKETLNAVPGLWIGIEDPDHPFYELFVVYGIYREFSFDIDNPIGPMATLELEEL